MAEYLSLSEAAEFTHLSKSFLYRNTSQKTIPFRKIGKKILFDRAELQAWIDAQRVTPALGA
jgi:excisionase family DNA binding protein